MPFGYVDWKKNCSTNRSSCCGWHIRSPNRRNSGSTIHAGAGWRSIPPTNRSGSCDRLHRWFHACSGRSHSYIPGSRFACRWHHFHIPEPMYGFRRKDKSTNHTSQDRGLYTHKYQDFLCNGRGSTHSTQHGRARYGSAIHTFLAASISRSLGSCQQCRWTRETQPSRALS